MKKEKPEARSQKPGARIRLLLASGFWLLASQTSALAQGCAMCKTALESSPEGRMLAGSFAQGILLLLFLPYLILGTVAYQVFRAKRKKSKQRGDAV